MNMIWIVAKFKKFCEPNVDITKAAIWFYFCLVVVKNKKHNVRKLLTQYFTWHIIFWIASVGDWRHIAHWIIRILSCNREHPSYPWIWGKYSSRFNWEEFFFSNRAVISYSANCHHGWYHFKVSFFTEIHLREILIMHLICYMRWLQITFISLW